MVDLTTIQWHNKKMQDEMQSLRVEHALFEELHNKMEIELLEKGEEIQKIIDGSYELFEERHDYQKLISGSPPPKVPFFDQIFQHFLSINKLMNSCSKHDKEKKPPVNGSRSLLICADVGTSHILGLHLVKGIQ
jgi:hypothetical protein